jgi:MYXO-CTERM domain-containing protein
VSDTSRTSDTRTPAQIEADIKRRRETLAETLDEIGVRVHPKTIVGDAKAKVASHIDHTLGRAYVGVNRVVGDVKGQLVTEDGAPRLERIVPIALLAAAGVGLLVVGSRRRKR